MVFAIITCFSMALGGLNCADIYYFPIFVALASSSYLLSRK